MSKTPDFEILTYDYANPEYQAWILPRNRHFLYILENGSDVYIGETHDIIARTKKHHNKNDYCYQFSFLRIHIITSVDMDGTPAKHFEKMLKCLMQADNKFRVTNQIDGQNTFYKRKNSFELGFDKLWIQLFELGLVKEKKFRSVLNSTAYKYSPYTELTAQQTEALTSVVGAILTSDTQREQYTNRSRPIMIIGDAGSGKTVIASSLFHYLKTNSDFRGKRIGLVYSNPSTREELKNVFKKLPEHLDKSIIAPIDVTKQHYDIIICDEAHRLRRNKNLGLYVTTHRKGNKNLGIDDTHDELDWLQKNSDCLVLLYDKQQIVCPSDIPYDEVFEKLNIDFCGIRPILLKDQMRIKAGNDYVPYIHAVLHQKATEPMSFEGYDFKLFDSFSDMMELF